MKIEEIINKSFEFFLSLLFVFRSDPYNILLFNYPAPSLLRLHPDHLVTLQFPIRASLFPMRYIRSDFFIILQGNRHLFQYFVRVESDVHEDTIDSNEDEYEEKN